MRKTLYLSMVLCATFIFGMVISYSINVEDVVPVVEIPMIEAAAVGQVDRVKRLLKDGATANIVDKEGNSPLAFAVWNGTYRPNQAIIELLLHHQADAKSRNRAGQAVIQQVVKIDYKVLRMQIIGKLIKFGALIGDADNQGFDLLQKTLATFDPISTEMLFDWWGRFISDQVAERGIKRALSYNMGDIVEIIERALKKRKNSDAHWDPSLIDKRTGLNDFHCAVITNNRSLVEKIISRESRLVHKASEDEYGMLPLHYAVLHGHSDMVDYLLKNNAQVNGVNLYGNTPLHMTSWLTDRKVAKKIISILVDKGAQLNAQNRDGNTLLHLLVYNNNQDLINYMKNQYSLPWGIPNNDHETPQQLAERLSKTYKDWLAKQSKVFSW